MLISPGVIKKKQNSNWQGGIRALPSYLPLMRYACFADWILLSTSYPVLHKKLTLKLSLHEACGISAHICRTHSSPQTSHYEHSCPSTCASLPLLFPSLHQQALQEQGTTFPLNTLNQVSPLENKRTKSSYTTFWRNSLPVVMGIKINLGFSLNAGLWWNLASICISDTSTKDTVTGSLGTKHTLKR